MGDVDRVAEDATTNTFVAARLWIDTECWRGVPFWCVQARR